MRGHGQVHWCWGYFSFVFLYLDTGSTVPGTVEVYKVGTIIILTLQIEKLKCTVERLKLRLLKITELLRGILDPLYYANKQMEV